MSKDLEEASRGLLFISERDAPFAVVDAPDIPFATLDPRELLGRPATDAVETVSVDYFFRNAIDYDARYQRLIALLPRDAKVFRVGRIDVAVLIVGTGPNGGTLGLSTTVVET